MAFKTTSTSTSTTTSETTEVVSWSTPNQDECLWAGVRCNRYDKVHQIRWNGLRLFGTISPEIAILDALAYLDLSDNDIVGTIPERFYELQNLEHVYLYRNDISGSISTAGINGLINLKTLHLSHNQLSGPLPEVQDNSMLSRLRYLNLYRNQFTGSIPLSWRHLTGLYYLDLGHNQLSGALPSNWKDKNNNLRHLQLDHNQFTGEIPDYFIGKLGGGGSNGQLETLTLDHNLLEGTVPTKDASTSRLVLYTLHENNFSQALSSDTCEMSIFAAGHVVEFKADCDICSCDDVFCGNCAQ